MRWSLSAGVEVERSGQLHWCQGSASCARAPAGGRWSRWDRPGSQGRDFPAPAPPLAEVIWSPPGGRFLAPRVPDGDSGRWETVLAVWPLFCASAGAPRTPGPGQAGRGAPLLPRPWTVEVRRHWRREKLNPDGKSFLRPTGSLDAEPNNFVFLRSACLLRLVARGEVSAYLRRSYLRRTYVPVREEEKGQDPS